MLKFHYDQDQLEFTKEAALFPELVRLVMLGVMKKDKARTAIVTHEATRSNGRSVFSVDVIENDAGVRMIKYDIYFVQCQGEAEGQYTTTLR